MPFESIWCICSVGLKPPDQNLVHVDGYEIYERQAIQMEMQSGQISGKTLVSWLSGLQECCDLGFNIGPVCRVLRPLTA